MEEQAKNWQNIEIKNLDNSISVLQQTIAEERKKKSKHRGYKSRKNTISRQEAEADVKIDLEAVLNHLFTTTTTRVDISLDHTFALRRLVRAIVMFEEGDIGKEEITEEVQRAIAILRGQAPEDRSNAGDEGAPATSKRVLRKRPNIKYADEIDELDELVGGVVDHDDDDDDADHDDGNSQDK
ncbi:hypothetical protein SPBR_04464 [Sporothrix brasiliensis 5110]|uniref:Uncharacterized protein n=1 Tax=Sporothrix brasiliensis 5110 TaxID=1398154 RepID=A0A0C2J311_9PEZI|nr:uncharacterized protein SPBR_04464 [Sporothrix brasiliensis 5110]KIH93420.1 hypothetical protein SPBR_04464 [Sporothrix brasiliensis 5110]